MHKTKAEKAAGIAAAIASSVLAFLLMLPLLIKFI